MDRGASDWESMLSEKQGRTAQKRMEWPTEPLLQSNRESTPDWAKWCRSSFRGEGNQNLVRVSTRQLGCEEASEKHSVRGERSARKGSEVRGGFCFV